MDKKIAATSGDEMQGADESGMAKRFPSISGDGVQGAYSLDVVKEISSILGDGMQGAYSSGMDKAIANKRKREFKSGQIGNDSDAMRRGKWPRKSKLVETWDFHPLLEAFLEALRRGPLRQEFSEMMLPLVRRVVAEYFETTYSRQIFSPRQIASACSRNLSLHFKNEIASSTYTKDRLKDIQGSPMLVELRDKATGKVVTTGSEAEENLELLVLQGDFDNEDWSWEEFDHCVVKEHRGKEPLLIGNVNIALKKGVGTFDDVKFAVNSSRTPSKTYRLGVRLRTNSSNCFSIREGKSGAFQVKERRGKYYEKHKTPLPEDKVWRLKNISKGGPFHKKLKGKGIKTVGQLLGFCTSDARELKTILGSRMSEKRLIDTVEHARTCNYKSDGNKLGELPANNSKLAREMNETISNSDPVKMSILEVVHAVEGGDHGKESGALAQNRYGNTATAARRAVEDPQSAQHLPFHELHSHKAPLCSYDETFCITATLGKYNSSSLQASQTESEGFLTCFGETLSIDPTKRSFLQSDEGCERYISVPSNTPLNEITGNGELFEIQGSFTHGTTNLSGACGHSLIDSGDNQWKFAGSSSESRKKFKKVGLSICFAMRCIKNNIAEKIDDRINDFMDMGDFGTDISGNSWQTFLDQDIANVLDSTFGWVYS